ncbi:hypothetical protein ACGF1Z_35340 [Streptomyces sp. NPDC048018]|uniref:DUF7489 domain-containing protein n=1 Tax=Streptomyces sp. NPDC048018 TaxID=3365499 RepID=UPI00371BC802
MKKSRTSGHDDAWEGVVTGRSRGMLDGSNMYHFLEIRLSDGAFVKIRVGRRLWKSIDIDDRVVKEPGSDPVKG